MSILTRIRNRLTFLRCNGCGRRVESLYDHHGDWRCNPCVVRRVRGGYILRRLERDGILTIIKES